MRKMWLITLPIPTALYHTSNRTNNGTQEDVDSLGSGLEPHVPGSIVCQLLVPTCGDMYTTRECAHVVSRTNTISGIVQTQPWEAHSGDATNEAGAACGCGRARCQIDFLLQRQLRDQLPGFGDSVGPGPVCILLG